MSSRVGMAIAVLFALALGAQAQNYNYTRVVDSNTARPDGQGNLSPTVWGLPAIEGPWVVFEDSGPATANDSLWSYNLLTGRYTKLADLNTPVPHGSGNFTGFFEAFSGAGQNRQIRQGTLLFAGYDGAGLPGVYTVPVSGGTISRVVDTHTSLPFAGPFQQLLGGYFSMALDSGKVVVSAMTNNPNDSGVWSAKSAGGGLKRLADVNTVYCKDPPKCFVFTNLYSSGTVQGAHAAFIGTGISGGYYGLFVTPVGGPSTLAPIHDSTEQLPGDPTSNFFTAYFNPLIDGKHVYFNGYDPNYTGPCGQGWYAGFYATAMSGGTIKKFVDTCDTFPGVSQINGQNSFQFWTVDHGTLMFGVTDANGGARPYSIIAANNGKFTRVVGEGDVLDDGPVAVLTGPGNGSLNEGRLAFFANEGSPPTAVYVASGPCGPNLTSDVSITLSALTFNSKTKLYSQTATVKNTSGSSIAGPLALVLGNLSSDATLVNSTGTTVCFAPQGSPLVDLILPASNVLKNGASVKTTLSFSDPSNGAITFTPKLAGPGAQ